ncbi:MAG: pentapeptide repeat-containing protein [Pseudomonadota bacterium]|nr:pentapeptide repeat-containing protein [Pseudomonadota bacterium]
MSDAAFGLGQEQDFLSAHEVSGLEHPAGYYPYFPQSDANQKASFLRQVNAQKGAIPAPVINNDIQDLRSPCLSGNSDNLQMQLNRYGTASVPLNPKMRNINLRLFDLRGKDLSGIDFRGADLRGVDFTGSDLRNALVYGCDFRGAIMDKVNLQGANISDSNFSDVRMVGANLSNIQRAGDANFRGTNLHDADLSNSYFGTAKLSGIKLAGSTRHGFSMSSPLGLLPINRIIRMIGVLR